MENCARASYDSQAPPCRSRSPPKSVLIDVARSEENWTRRRGSDQPARPGRGVPSTSRCSKATCSASGTRPGLRRTTGGGAWHRRAPARATKVAAELMRRWRPRGADSLPLCLREAATRRLGARESADAGHRPLFEQVSAASAHLDAATLGRISAAFAGALYWRRPEGLATRTAADMDAFLSVCQEAALLARVAARMARRAAGIPAPLHACV